MRNASFCFAICALSASCTTTTPRENFRDPSDGLLGGTSGGGSGVGAQGGTGGGASGIGGMSGDEDASGPFDASEPMLDSGHPDDLGTPDGLRNCGAAPIAAGTFTREALRGASADCAMWQYCELENEAAWLAHLIGKYAEESTPYRRESARDAWRSAMASWSKVELFQFGPLPSAVPSAGKDIYQGQNHRDRIYSWPAASRCRVEEQVISGKYAESGFDRVLISARGLLALEYLLFYDGDDSACATSSSTYAEWNALSADARAQKKLAYAQAVASNVLETARNLNDAWSADDGNFRAVFVSASGYPDESEAMNVLGWSLAYVDKELKDWKIGVPAGHTATSPVSGPESPYAHAATDNWKANLRGFRALFQGCGANGAGLGFDDWLSTAGHATLADDIVSAWQNAQTKVDALGPLEQTAPTDLEAAYQAVRELAALLSSELLGAGSPLNLKLPATLEGDTD